MQIKYIYILILLLLLLLYLNLNKSSETFTIHKNPKILFLMRSYNRPEYLEKSLKSLDNTDITKCFKKIIYDDNSNKETLDILKKYEQKYDIIYNNTNYKQKSMVKLLDIILNRDYDYDYICYLDNDIETNKNLIEKCINIFELIKKEQNLQNDKILLTGFNSHRNHKTIKKYENYIEKNTIGGIHMFFHKSLIKKIRDWWNRGQDWEICYGLKGEGGRIFCAKPSIIDHIGIIGDNSSGIDKYDKAIDYESFKNYNNFLNFDKITVINLESSSERLNYFKNMCNNLNIKYNRISAINGFEYKLNEKEKEIFSNIDYDIKKKKGVLGCHLSHIKAIKKNQNELFSIICEDDINILDTNFINIINTLIKKIDVNNNYLIYLSGEKNYSAPKDKIISLNDKYALYKINKEWYGQGNMGYFVTQKCMKEILEKNNKNYIKTAIDVHYSRNLSNILIIWPPLINHRKNIESDIGNH